MWFQRLTALATAAVASAAAAHPGHPTLSTEHSHAFFGIDPWYVLLFVVIGAVVALTWRRARGRAHDVKRK